MDNHDHLHPEAAPEGGKKIENVCSILNVKSFLVKHIFNAFSKLKRI